MWMKLYVKLSPYISGFLLITTIVFFSMCVWRGEVILGLQAQLIKDNKQEIKVIVEQQESATKISLDYEQNKSVKQQEKIYVDREIEKVITVPMYSNLCFDDSGLHLINGEISKINSARQPTVAVPSDTGVE